RAFLVGAGWVQIFRAPNRLTWRRKNYLILLMFLVLPVRIELTTSPLPRGCSTTELRQRRPQRKRQSYNAAASAPILATRPEMAQACGVHRPISTPSPSVS